MTLETSTPENKGVRIEYKFRGKYGEILSSGTNDNLNFSPPEGAVEFDGYLITKYDNFAFQGTIDEARELFKKIARLEHLTEVLSRLESNISEAWARRNKKELEEIKIRKQKTLAEMDSLEQITNAYKI